MGAGQQYGVSVPAVTQPPESRSRHLRRTGPPDVRRGTRVTEKGVPEKNEVSR